VPKPSSRVQLGSPRNSGPGPCPVYCVQQNTGSPFSALSLVLSANAFHSSRSESMSC
jgi:hypothetical protein